MRQRRIPQGPEENQKIVRPQCLDGLETINIVQWQLQTTLWPFKMVSLSRQNCRVPTPSSVVDIQSIVTDSQLSSLLRFRPIPSQTLLGQLLKLIK